MTPPFRTLDISASTIALTGTSAGAEMYQICFPFKCSKGAESGGVVDGSFVTFLKPFGGLNGWAGRISASGSMVCMRFGFLEELWDDLVNILGEIDSCT